MALMICKDCKAGISTDAKVCPKCGATNPTAYKAARFGGLIYLGVLALAFYWIWGLMTPEPKSETAIPYTITKDEHREGQPRKVEALLPRRLSETELAEVSAAVRDDTNVKATRTFIGYRVEGQQDGAYWANAQFDPAYQGHLIGLSAADYQKLQVIDLSNYSETLGHWLTDGALGHVKVLYQKEGSHFIDLLFADGGESTEQYLAKKLPDGSLRLEEPENDFGEYYVVDTDGNLQGWSENGNYLTLPPNVPAI